MAQVLKYHGRRLQHVILSGSLVFFLLQFLLSSPRSFLSQDVSLACGEAARQSGTNPQLCQYGEMPGRPVHLCFVSDLLSDFFIYLRRYTFLDLWSMRNLVLLLTYFLLVLPLIATQHQLQHGTRSHSFHMLIPASQSSQFSACVIFYLQRCNTATALLLSAVLPRLFPHLDVPCLLVNFKLAAKNLFN